MWNLNNKKVVITGGTKGIGKATVYEFLQLGARVLFSSRNNQDLIDFESELRQQNYDATGIYGDISIKEDQLALVQWVEKNWGALDVLVNNAGHGINKPLDEITREDYNSVIEIILIAPFEIALLMYPFLRKGICPSIINVSSVAGILDVHTGVPYGTSKAGLIQQTKNLAVEWATDGIRVNAVSPWFTNTPRAANLLENESLMRTILSRTPLHRVARADEVAAVIAFLAMDKSSYITGQNIIVDGGMSIKGL